MGPVRNDPHFCRLAKKQEPGRILHLIGVGWYSGKDLSLPNKKIMHVKQNYMSISLMYKDIKVLNKILVNQIQQYIYGLINEFSEVSEYKIDI